MPQYYFRVPFAGFGDVATIPVATQPDGSMNFTDGFGLDYELDPDTNPNALDIPRTQTNELFFLITAAMQILQQHGFPDFIAASDNGGTPYPYDKNSTVRYAGINYYSLIDANTDTPPSANWGVVSYSPPELTGVGKDFWGITLPDGYVWGNGTTIGNASSGGSGRANADTQNLFTLLWNGIPNSTLPIQDSAGAASTRGVSAAADFAANKRLPVPDKRDMVSIGAGNMGGTTDRGLITTGGSGIAGTTMGANGGAETVSLTSNQNGSHVHTGTTDAAGVHNHSYVTDFGNYTVQGGNDFVVAADQPGTFTTGNAGSHQHTFTTGSSGTGAAHQNVQPTIVCNYIIKL